MTVSERINEGATCETIDLTEAEKKIYSGEGWHVARFVEGELVELFNPFDVPHEKNSDIGVKKATRRALRWIKCADGELWLVMCSCGKLYEPTPILGGGAAKLARIIGQTITTD